MTEDCLLIDDIVFIGSNTKYATATPNWKFFARLKIFLSEARRAVFPRNFILFFISVAMVFVPLEIWDTPAFFMTAMGLILLVALSYLPVYFFVIASVILGIDEEDNPASTDVKLTIVISEGKPNRNSLPSTSAASESVANPIYDAKI